MHAHAGTHTHIKQSKSQIWLFPPVISALREPMQEDQGYPTIHSKTFIHKTLGLLSNPTQRDPLLTIAALACIRLHPIPTLNHTGTTWRLKAHSLLVPTLRTGAVGGDWNL